MDEGELRRRRSLHRFVDGVFDVAVRDGRAFDARGATDDAGVEARTGIRRNDTLHRRAGHGRGFFERHLNGAGAGVEIAWLAGSDGGRSLVAHAEHAQRALRM